MGKNSNQKRQHDIRAAPHLVTCRKSGPLSRGHVAACSVGRSKASISALHVSPNGPRAVSAPQNKMPVEYAHDFIVGCKKTDVMVKIYIKEFFSTKINLYEFWNSAEPWKNFKYRFFFVFEF